jgi:cation transport ATPase
MREWPIRGILLSPIFAAAAMSFISVSVIGNALRLRGGRYKPGPERIIVPEAG